MKPQPIQMSQPGSLPSEYLSPRSPRFPHYCTSLINRMDDLIWEKRLGVTTTGGVMSPHPDANFYGWLSYHTYFKIFDYLRLKPADVVVDLGSGKGRPSFIAAQYPIHESVGVEIHPPLYAIAEANRMSLKMSRAPVRFVCQSATDFDYDSTTVIVMFHPFGAETMNAVLARVGESLRRRPRDLRIAYGNPMLGALITAKPWMERYTVWNPGTWSRLKFPVHFYRSTVKSG